MVSRGLLASKLDKIPAVKAALGTAMSPIASVLNLTTRSLIRREGEARQQLQNYKDIHRGETCVIVGNGPSLKKVDLSLLESVPSFGMNRISLMFEASSYRPTYLVCVNRLLIDQIGPELLETNLPLFLDSHARTRMSAKDATWLRRRIGPYFASRPDLFGYWGGATVTYVCLQLAYFMGFDRVVLVGVDHRFTAVGKPHGIGNAVGPDQNHFDERYFSGGAAWQFPDLETSERAYRLAKRTFERDGRVILDATIDGALAVFPKVDLASALLPKL